MSKRKANTKGPYQGKPSELHPQSIMKKVRGEWICTGDKKTMRSRDLHTVLYLKQLKHLVKPEESTSNGSPK